MSDAFLTGIEPLRVEHLNFLRFNREPAACEEEIEAAKLVACEAEHVRFLLFVFCDVAQLQLLLVDLLDFPDALHELHANVWPPEDAEPIDGRVIAAALAACDEPCPLRRVPNVRVVFARIVDVEPAIERLLQVRSELLASFGPNALEFQMDLGRMGWVAVRIRHAGKAHVAYRRGGGVQRHFCSPKLGHSKLPPPHARWGRPWERCPGKPLHFFLTAILGGGDRAIKISILVCRSV